MDPGPILLIVAAIVFVPILFAGGLALAGVLGWALKEEAEVTHEGSELIDLNR